MIEEEFWEIIALLDWSQVGDDDAVIEPAVNRLADRGFEEICAFEEILATKLYALDTEQHARHIGEQAYAGEASGDYPICADGSFFSVDGFLYARCVVVAQGKDLYERVLARPGTFPPDLEFDALLDIGLRAFERATGEDHVHTTALSYETFSNRAGWERNQ